MPTLLSSILFIESIKQVDIANYIAERFEPRVQTYQISAICKGKQKNGQVKTYLKIIEAINYISNKNYTITDIIEPDFIKQDLKTITHARHL